jgi:GTPase SAR1 family protein
MKCTLSANEIRSSCSANNLLCLRFSVSFAGDKLIKLVSAVSEHKIVIVGLDNAGKTTILYQFLMNEVSNNNNDCKKLICQQNEIEPPEFYVKSNNYSLVVATQIKPELLQFVSFSHLGTLDALLRAIAVRAFFCLALRDLQ